MTTLTVNDVPWSRDPATGSLVLPNINEYLNHINNAQDFFPSTPFNLTNGSGDSLNLGPASPYQT